jgi:hypothetical protein
MAMYKEFKNLEIPPFLLTDGWCDDSRSNDSCPHSIRKLDLAQEGDYPMLGVWVEYDERAEREEEIDDKYAVEVYLTKEDYEMGKVLRLYAGEDSIEAQIAIRNAPEEINKLKNPTLAIEKAPEVVDPPKVEMPAMSAPQPYGRSSLIHELCVEFAAGDNFAPMAANNDLYISLGKALVAKIYLCAYNGGNMWNCVVVSLIGQLGEIDSHDFQFSDYFVVDKESKYSLSHLSGTYSGSPYICANKRGEDWYAGVRPESTAPLVRAVKGYVWWWREHYAV